MIAKMLGGYIAQPMSRLRGLDALRGVAALMVFVHHWQGTYGLPGVNIPFKFAVDAFFVLSGFVMARTYEDRMRAGMKTIEFIKMRYRRLFALMAIGTTIGLVFYGTRYGVTPNYLAAFITTLLFIPWPTPAGAFALNYPCWSLFVEVFCNIIHPRLLALASERLILVGIGVCGGMTLLAAFFTGGVFFGGGMSETIAAIPRGLTSYLIGVLVYRRWQDFPLGNSPWLAVLLFPALLIAATPLPIVVTAAAVIFVIAPVTLRAALAMGESRIATGLGAMSFPLYAIHAPLLQLAYPVGAVGAAILVLGATSLMTVIIHRLSSKHQDRSASDVAATIREYAYGVHRSS